MIKCLFGKYLGETIKLLHWSSKLILLFKRLLSEKEEYSFAWIKKWYLGLFARLRTSSIFKIPLYYLGHLTYYRHSK